MSAKETLLEREERMRRGGVEREGKSKEGMRNQKSPGEYDYRQHG